MRSDLATMETTALWRLLPGLLERPRVGAWRLPPVSRMLADVDAALRRAGVLIDYVVTYPGTLGLRTMRAIRAELAQAMRVLVRGAAWAARMGAAAAGDVLLILAQRIGASIEALAKGGGDAFRAFWGFGPGVAVGAATLAGLAVVAGLGWVLLNPGTQALLAQGIAAGGPLTGQALRVSAPLVKGTGQLLGGAGSALAKLL